MGKKSRLKKERRVLNSGVFSQDTLKKLVTFDGYNEPIYRFFPEEWQAESLCKGNVWMSTLETCRQYEDPLQGDPEEATHTYNSGHIFGGSDDPAFVEMAARSGVYIGPGCSGITISSCKNIQRISDAYVLCTTKEFSPQNLSNTFGNYCVKISNPTEFFKLISIALHKKRKIREGSMGLVQYKDRDYTGLQPPPGPIGFVKPSDKYSPQKEFRLLWIPEDFESINPFLLECPEVSELCSQIA